jgi:hypothetical protein
MPQATSAVNKHKVIDMSNCAEISFSLCNPFLIYFLVKRSRIFRKAVTISFTSFSLILW